MTRLGYPRLETRPVLRSVRGGIGLALIVLAVAALTESMASLSLKQTVTYACVVLILVLALYCFSGLTGVVSFGHVAFAAIGAYVGAFLTDRACP